MSLRNTEDEPEGAAPPASPLYDDPSGSSARPVVPFRSLSRRDVAGLLESHGLRPSAALGQHFVIDPNTVRRIARLAGVGPGDRVVEIGAGLGSLTLALAETGAEVVAVELDRYLTPVLRSVVEPVGVRVVQGDARTLVWDEVLGPGHGGGPAETPEHGGPEQGGPEQGGPEHSGPEQGRSAHSGPEQGGPEHRRPGAGVGRPGGWVLVANLPYNVATPLVMDLLEGVPAIARMLVMVQREVGERLAAGAGDDAYGAVSVKLAYRARAKVVGRVPATVFLPRPNVESVLVEVVRRPEPAVDADPRLLFPLVQAGFAHRRKMLRRSLAGLVAPEAFAAAGVRPEARAEELDILTWGKLTECASRYGTRPPPS
ncbi:MAG TPA: rRNA adenine dimethyltransferase family protein [Acidimicrobiales bacterium]|nr:rRNA adenine dimethyltransferase family protein [Acidimicrobiales bacterium]